MRARPHQLSRLLSCALAALWLSAPAAVQAQSDGAREPSEPLVIAPLDIAPPPPRQALPAVRGPETPETPGFAPDQTQTTPRAIPDETPPPKRPDHSLAPGENAFDADSWREWAGGRTVVYFDSAGRLDGFERFARNGDRADWRFVDGPCEQGRWTERGGVFCFNYPTGRFCYWHLRRDGEVYVRSVDDGEEFLARLSDEPLQCGPGDVSAFESPRALAAAGPSSRRFRPGDDEGIR